MFWGGVVARSPLTQATGTPYDDAWRAINRFMVERSVAGHQRNVMLRNDGHGGFDDVSGAVGLDLDEDGRAFAVPDVDRRRRPRHRLAGPPLRAAAPPVPQRLRGAPVRRSSVPARLGDRRATATRSARG